MTVYFPESKSLTLLYDSCVQWSTSFICARTHLCMWYRESYKMFTRYCFARICFSYSSWWIYCIRVRWHELHGVSDHRPLECLFKIVFKHQRKFKGPHYWPFVNGIHRSPVDSIHKGPVMRKAFPCLDAIMDILLIAFRFYWYWCSLLFVPGATEITLNDMGKFDGH